MINNNPKILEVLRLQVQIFTELGSFEMSVLSDGILDLNH